MIIEKLILGLSLAIPFGPVSCEMIRRGLSGGFSAAMKIRLTSLIGHGFCLVAASLGVNILKRYQLGLAVLSLFSSLFLIYIGFKAIGKKIDLNIEAYKNEKNILTTGLALSLANPISITFWLGLFSYGATTSSSRDGLLINSFILVGILVWGIIFASLLSLGKKFINKNILQTLTKASGLLLLFYGAMYTFETLKALHRLI